MLRSLCNVVALIALHVVAPALAQPIGTITTVAGGGLGDGGLATSASLSAPGGVAVDAAGNIFIADTGNSRVRKITPDGAISTVYAGSQAHIRTTFPIFQTSAASCPADVNVDALGNVYVADFCGHVIRKIATDGNATVVAGKGFHTTPADPAGDGGSALAATITFPRQVAVDPLGNLFMLESGRIRKVTNGTITTVFGASTPGVSAMAADGAGGVFFYFDTGAADFNKRVHHMSSSGTLTAIAGNGTIGPTGDGGPALQAGLEPILSMVPSGGHVLLLSATRLRRVTGGTIDTVVSINGRDFTQAGTEYLVAVGDQVVRVAESSIQPVAGTGSVAQPRDGGPALSATLNAPRAVVVGSDGVIYIADTGHHRVRKVDASGVMSTVAGDGLAGFAGDGGAAVSARLSSPSGLALDHAGNLFISDRDNQRIRRIDPAGNIATIAGTGTQGSSGDGGSAIAAQLNNPGALTLDGTGNLYVADVGNYRVRKVDSAGVISTYAGGGNNFADTTARQATSVYTKVADIALDGESGNLLVTEAHHGKVLSVDAFGLALVHAFVSSSPPVGVAAASGGVHFTDENGTIRRRTGISSAAHVAGRENCGFSQSCPGFGGDGGPATAAELNRPTGLFWSSAGGALYVADTGNNRIRRILLADPMPAAFAFPAQGGVPLSATVVSAPIVPSGFHGVTPISVANGQYSVGCTGTWTSETGSISSGESVCVRQTSSSLNNGRAVTTLTIGGRAGTFVSATVLGPGSTTADATVVDFGGQSMNTTSLPRTISVSNTGSVAVTMHEALTAGAFSASHECTTLDVAATCVVTVRFVPTGVGAFESTLVLRNTSGNNSITLRGHGERSLATHYYQSILRRAPDADGKAYWDAEATRVSALGANVNETWYNLASAFLFSPEYRSFQRTDTEFLTDLYRTFFNREPDAGGLAFWQGQLASGLPRDSVLASFVLGPEFTNFTARIFGNAPARAEVDTVMDFYRGFLGRLPDTGGFEYWIARFRQAQCITDFAARATAVRNEANAISGLFVHSAEYLARNRSNAEYVSDLYNAFMRRGGELGGVTQWVDRLNANVSNREIVRGSFRDSAEFQTRVSRIAQQGCMS